MQQCCLTTSISNRNTSLKKLYAECQKEATNIILTHKTSIDREAHLKIQVYHSNQIFKMKAKFANCYKVLPLFSIRTFKLNTEKFLKIKRTHSLSPEVPNRLFYKKGVARKCKNK